MDLEQIALSHLKGGDYLSAIALYEQCIEENPNCISNYWYLGLTFILQNEETLAQSVWFSVLMQAESDMTDIWISDLVQVLESAALFQVQIENLDNAKQLYSQILNFVPTHLDSNLNLGAICFQGNEVEAGINFLEKALEIDPDSYQAYSSLGAIYKNIMTDTAIQYLERAIELKPDYAISHYNLGSCFFDKQQLKNSVFHLEAAIELQPDFVDAYVNLGMAYREQGNIEKAIYYLERAINLRQNCSEAYYNLGFCFRDQGDFVTSISYFRRAHELDPSGDAAKRIQQLIHAEQSGYALDLSQGLGAWDPILLKDENYYRLFYLIGSRRVSPFWSTGELATAISTDMQQWQYLGIALKPNAAQFWESGRMLAGSVYKENGIYYFFYSAAPSGEKVLQEGIGLATSQDGLNWQRRIGEFIEPDAQFYGTQPGLCQERVLQHRAWRDPYMIQDSETGKFYLFITACSSKHSSPFQGCIGLAVSDLIDGPYQVLPPAAVPMLDGTDEGIFVEMERSQVIYKNNKYYLFFSAWPRAINPKWIMKVGKEEITDSSLYCYVSEKITGPFRPISDKPIVKGSDKSGLYATNFITAPDGQLIAYGSYSTFTLEVSPQFPVIWEDEYIEILID